MNPGGTLSADARQTAGNQFVAKEDGITGKKCIRRESNITVALSQRKQLVHGLIRSRFQTPPRRVHSGIHKTQGALAVSKGYLIMRHSPTLVANVRSSEFTFAAVVDISTHNWLFATLHSLSTVFYQ